MLGYTGDFWRRASVMLPELEAFPATQQTRAILKLSHLCIAVTTDDMDAGHRNCIESNGAKLPVLHHSEIANLPAICRL